MSKEILTLNNRSENIANILLKYEEQITTKK